MRFPALWLSVLLTLASVAPVATAPPQALVVGIDLYPPQSGWAPVRGSEGDARELARALREAGFQVGEKTGAAANRRELLSALAGLRSACRAGSPLALVFFSGRAFGHTRGDFLAPHDARSSSLATEGISLQELRSACPRGATVLLLDAPAEERPPGLLTLKPALASGPGLSELRAGRPGRETGFVPELGGRVFARALIAGLEGGAADGEGKIDLEGLGRYLDRAVRRWSFETGQRQAPQLAIGANPVLATGHEPPLLSPAPIAGADWRGQPISLSLKDADLQEVLRSLARLGGVQLVLDPGVRGTVTLELHEVPWDQALDIILRTQGLGAVVEGPMIRVETRPGG